MKVVCLLVMHAFLLNQHVSGKSLLYILNVFDNKNTFSEMPVDLCLFYSFITLLESLLIQCICFVNLCHFSFQKYHGNVHHIR